MSCPPVVVIDDGLSMEQRVELLLGVLSRDNSNPEQTIEICADIDLTGKVGIEIWDNRSLIAPPSCARGPRSLGPRVYITSANRTFRGAAAGSSTPTPPPSGSRGATSTPARGR